MIVRLPDPEKMQVKARINESRIDYVREGLPVVIRLDACRAPNWRARCGTVSDYPMPTGWFGSNVKEYATFIEIRDPPDAMRPGMTAEVAIRTEQLENALQLPAQAVFERGSKHWCIVPDGSNLTAKQVKIGATNDKFVVLQRRACGNDVSIQQSAQVLKDVDLPDGGEEDPKANAGQDASAAG